MKLITVLERLQILWTFRGEDKEVQMWRMPADGTQDEHIVSDLDRHIPLALEVARGGKFDPKIQLVWLADGPDFTSPMPPRDHEIHVARFYRFLSLVLWSFLRHTIDPSLEEPRKVISLAHTYVERRKPDIVLLHRVHSQRTKPKWAHIASIGKNCVICGCI
jgi:hypothetical protein